MLDNWRSYNSFVVVTKTGTGKTISAILPILKNQQRAICVYPTNELIRDQVRNIQSIAEREGLRVCIQTPDTLPEEYSLADVVLVHIDAHILDIWCDSRRWRKKWRALRYLLETDKPKIVLTNPDILFLIFALRYRAESLASLSGYHALIVDEFHLYSGVELSHALFMLHLGRSLNMFEKIVLLSATPSTEVSMFLDQILDGPLRIDASMLSDYPVRSTRYAAHRVEIRPHFAGSDVVETTIDLIKEIEYEIRERRQNNSKSDYVPAVVVLNSVINAIRLEDRLAEEGFSRAEMSIIRGLSAKEVRDAKGKLLAIGTSAIEVGIDFLCDFLIFEASEASSFIQRFGRVGRHKQGIAIVLFSQNAIVGINHLGQQKGPEVDRGDLEKSVYDWYPSLDVRAWFSTTFAGLISAFVLAENIINQVHSDFKAKAEHVAMVEESIESIYSAYVLRLGLSDCVFKRVLSYLRKARRQNSKYEWLNAYRNLNTFRTSMPSEWVFDLGEFKRRDCDYGKAKYKVDIVTLLRRAERLRFNPRIPRSDGKMGMLEVKGYGRYKKSWITPTFTDDNCGILYCTNDFPDLVFIQEGHKTSVSHVMALQNHIFVVVPKTISPELDWRLPVFECGRHLIAFDGTALLLFEIYNKQGIATIVAN